MFVELINDPVLDVWYGEYEEEGWEIIEEEDHHDTGRGKIRSFKLGAINAIRTRGGTQK